MAKKKKVKSSSNQQTVVIFVPDAIAALGDGVCEVIGALNGVWATPFGVTSIEVLPISTMSDPESMSARHRPQTAR
jgi:hypothetical protein